MTRTYKTQGIILSRQNTGEADRIITLFSKHFGKKVLRAKGIRKIKSRRAPYLEPFSHVDIFCHKGKSLDIITEVQSIEPYSFIRSRLERVGFALSVLEIVDRLTPQHQESIEVYLKLIEFLAYLNDPITTRVQVELMLKNFKRNILISLGFLNSESMIANTDRLIESISERKLKSPQLLMSLSP